MASLHHREAGREGDPAVVCLHGFPQSSYLWRDLLPAIGEAGFHAIAPDLPGFGRSAPLVPGTWEQQMEAVEQFRREIGLERLALVVHDWGGLIGLRWACDHPGDVWALVITGSGFFPDGKWHGMGQLLRTPGTGEKALAQLTPEAFARMFASVSPGSGPDAVEDYARCIADEAHRDAVIALYRSADFEKLAPYEGELARMDVPTLLLWGEEDPYAPVAGAYRFKKEIPHAELVIVGGFGHFLLEDEPGRCRTEIVEFLRRAGRNA